MPDELMAGAGFVEVDEDLPPEPGRDLADRSGQHPLMVSERA